MKFIAEIGINHNGDINIAKKLIRVAKQCGVNIVKFQKRTPDLCVPDEMKNEMRRDTPWGDVTYLDYRKKVEFWENEYDEIDAYCKIFGIAWTASAWDVESQKFLRRYDLEYNKVASPMLTHLELLKVIADEKKHTFISTGMSTISQIDAAVGIFRDENCPFELMHCNSTYPMPYEEANLRCIETLRARYKCDVGYSGHERGLQISLAAITFGVSSLERHITLDRTMWGSDQAASLESHGLKTLIRDAKIIEMALGDGVKRVYAGELKKQKQLRRFKELLPQS